MLMKNILYFIQCYPGIDTRLVIDYFHMAGIRKQRICGYLSLLKRRKMISMNVIHPGRQTLATVI